MASDWIKKLDALIYEAGVDVTLDGGKTWQVRHPDCPYFAWEESVCTKCGKWVPKKKRD